MAKYKIVKVSESDNVVGFIALMVIAGLVNAFSNFFTGIHMPTEEDLNGDFYREKIFNVGTYMLIGDVINVWEGTGFNTDSSSHKQVVVKEDNRADLYMDIAEKTKYFGNGKYQIYTKICTELMAQSNDYKTREKIISIYSEYIITLEIKPQRSWYGKVNLNPQIIKRDLVKIYPNKEKITNAILNWEQPKDKNPKW